MLLVEFTINATLHRISMEGIPLTHWWDNKIIAFDPPQYSIVKTYGGYCQLRYGSIRLNPDLFENGWPPPINCDITVKYTATDEASAETLFTGKAHIAQANRTGIKYDIYGPSYSTTKAISTAWNDTLVNVMSAACSDLSLTLDSSAARSPSPTVIHTLTSDRLLIDIISDFCAFYTHLFYISGSTLYLVDMLGDNGTRIITEFGFFPSDYKWQVPLSAVTNNDYTKFSAYPYGNSTYQEAYHSTGSNIEDAFEDILDIVHKPGTALKIPLLGSLPVPGEKISWTDTALAQDTDMYIRARKLRYDFEKEEITVEGEGVISAA